MKFRYPSVNSTAHSTIMGTKLGYGPELYKDIQRPASPTDIVVAALFPDSAESPMRTARYVAPRRCSTSQSNTEATRNSHPTRLSLDSNIVSEQYVKPKPVLASRFTSRRDLSTSHDQIRNFSDASTTASFDEWYHVNPHWPTFRDVDVHAVWSGLPSSAVELDIKLQILAQAGETKEIFHHSHETVREWSLVSAEPDPHALYFRKFKDQRESSAARRLDQWLSSESTGTTSPSTDDALSPTSSYIVTPPPSYNTVTVSKTRGTNSHAETVAKKSNYLRKRSARGKKEQALFPLDETSTSASALSPPQSPADSPTVTISPTHLIVSPTSNTRLRIHIKARINLVPHPRGGYLLRLPGIPVLSSDEDVFPEGVLRLDLPAGIHKGVCVYDDLLEKPVRVEAPTSNIEVNVKNKWEVRVFVLEDLIRKEEEETVAVAVVAPAPVVGVKESGKRKSKNWMWSLGLFLFLLCVFTRAFAHEETVAVEGEVTRWVVRAVVGGGGGGLEAIVESGTPAPFVLSVEIEEEEKEEEEGEGEEEADEILVLVREEIGGRMNEGISPGPVTVRDHIDWVLGWKGPKGEWQGLYL